MINRLAGVFQRHNEEALKLLRSLNGVVCVLGLQTHLIPLSIGALFLVISWEGIMNVNLMHVVHNMVCLSFKRNSRAVH